MATITHPSMRKSTPAPQTQEQEQTITPPQDLVVEDLSAFEGTSEVASTQVATFETKAKPKELSEETRKKIEDLIFLGRTVKTTTIAGHTFEISTLSHREHNALMKELARISSESDAWKTRIYILTGAIRSIDGVSFDDLDVGQEFASPFDKKLYVLDSMQLRVIEQLFLEYGNILEDTDKIVTGESIKKL